MVTSDLALVFFSILAQLGVGSFIILGIVARWVSKKNGSKSSPRLISWVWWAIFGIMALALIASLTHLGNVMNAYLSILNLQSAWLSREILFALLFTGLVGLYALMTHRKMGSETNRDIIWVLAALAGVALVFSMSMIYSYIRTQPAWHTPYTTYSFFNTAILLGALGAGVLTVVNYYWSKKAYPESKDDLCSPMQNSLKIISVIAIIGFGLEIVALPIYLTRLATDVEGGIKTLDLLVSEFNVLFILRIVLSFLGAGLLAAYIFRASTFTGKEKLIGNLTYVAFLLVLLGETIGRVIFYISKVRVGV